MSLPLCLSLAVLSYLSLTLPASHTHSPLILTLSAKIFFRHTQETQNYFFVVVVVFCCTRHLLFAHTRSFLFWFASLATYLPFPLSFSSATEPVATECIPPAKGDASHAVQAACACHSLPHPQGSSTALK